MSGGRILLRALKSLFFSLLLPWSISAVILIGLVMVGAIVHEGFGGFFAVVALWLLFWFLFLVLLADKRTQHLRIAVSADPATGTD